MSSVKTELYFRQVLGRILRINSSTPQQAWLFTFAEQSLIQFAERIEDDIPESCLYAHMGKPIESELSYQRNHLNDERLLLESQSTQSTNVSWGSGTGGISNQYAALAAFDELRLGAFKQRVISAFSST